jgi:hypothetical protein
MRKIFVAIVLVLILSLISCTPPSKEGRNALEALKKLSSKIEIDITYIDFVNSLGEVNFEVNKFFESPEAKSNPKLKDSIKKAMDYYLIAKEAWEYRNSMLDSRISPYLVFDKKFKEAWIKSYGEKCPEVAKEKENLITLTGSSCMARTIVILFKAASDELKNAEALVR